MIESAIHIGNFTFFELFTMLTNCMISILCLYFFIKLTKINTSEAIRNWNRFFLFFGLSNLFGAGAHGFFESHDGTAYKIVWLAMQLLNGLAVYSAQKATLHSVLQDKENRKSWLLAYNLQLTLFLFLVFSLQNFWVVVINNVVGLVPVIIIHLAGSGKTKARSLIGYGISISFLAGIVHALKLSLHEHFNNNVLSHVFIMISLTVIFMGVKQKALSIA